VRYFVFDRFSVGVDARYWAYDYYPFRPGSSSPIGSISGTRDVFGIGPGADYHFLLSEKWDAFVGASAVRVPSAMQTLVSPEIGLKYFISNGHAIGVNYEAPQSVGPNNFSGPAPGFAKSQELMLDLALFL
jgi:hypothetical protein